ncbi:hypothetical protein ACFSSA_13315 [Luteolibacter algae]|uniref:EF-hand domain-containing protein n=1 Tax=Luteolibacter algae TaxID=454151 RepID=A0ABW5DC61_9BACT
MKILSSLAVLALCACAANPGPIKRQMIGLIQKFDLWDYNGDGYLVASELKDAEKLSGNPVSEIIDFYDTNHDGRISLVEAQSGVSRVEEAREIVNDQQD